MSDTDSEASSTGDGSFASMLQILLEGQAVAGQARAMGICLAQHYQMQLVIVLSQKGIHHTQIFSAQRNESCSCLAGQLASEEWWRLRGVQLPRCPPEEVLQDVLRALFQAPALPSAFAGAFVGADPEDNLVAEGSSRDRLMTGMPCTAPPESLTSRWAMFGRPVFVLHLKTWCEAYLCRRLALHAMVFSNPRAVAMLWNRFVREVRFAHWEACTPLPRMAAAEPPAPDLGLSLLHQKLQMLDVCIHKRRLIAKQRAATEVLSILVPASRLAASSAVMLESSEG